MRLLIQLILMNFKQLRTMNITTEQKYEFVKEIYLNTTRIPKQRLSLKTIAQDHDINYDIAKAVVNALVERKIVSKHGEKKSQYLIWDPDKTKPNVELVESLSIKWTTEKYIRKPKETIIDISSFNDQELVEELRRRGWTVLAKKKITQILTLWEN